MGVSTAAPVQAVIQALWASGREVYALLDGSRDERIYDLVRRSGLDYRCLLGRGLLPSLARRAPYLVSLGRRSRLTREILELGWGRSWGLLLTSEAVLQELDRHFRRFLDVKDPAGRSLMLRLWDPRVLQAFLPVCTWEELAFLFGPVESFSLELVGSGRLQRFSRVAGGEAEGYLEEEILRVSGKVPARISKSLVAGHLRGPDPRRRRDRAFHLRQAHWDALKTLTRETFVERALGIIARTWPHTYRSLGEAEMRRFVYRGIARAQGYGVTGRRSVLHFLNLSLAFGEDFDRLPWAVKLLERRDLRGGTRIDLLRERGARAIRVQEAWR